MSEHVHKIRSKRLVTYIIILLSAVGTIAAQVRIHGKITDAQGEPIEFATVRIGGTAIGVTSGLEGEYTLSCAKADTITVYYSCIGYREGETQAHRSRGRCHSQCETTARHGAASAGRGDRT